MNVLILRQNLLVPVLLLQPTDQGIVVGAMKQMLIVVCPTSVTVDIMLLVMTTEHVILVGIGLGVIHLVKEVIYHRVYMGVSLCYCRVALIYTRRKYQFP